jgi:putative phosphoesterase
VLIGVVSDTHGYLDARLLAAFAGVGAIIHAGDVGCQDVIDGLAALAPVYAVCGNNDVVLGGLGLPETLDVELGGVRFHIVHELPKARVSSDARVVISGHSHRLLSEWRDGRLYLNPGAAGRRGFHSLLTAALVRVSGRVPEVESIVLGPRRP